MAPLQPNTDQTADVNSWTLRSDARGPVRSDARLTLQSVSYAAAPTAASSNLASPVTLYSQQTQQDTPSHHADSLLRDGQSQTASVSNPSSLPDDLVAYFAHPDFNPADFQLVTETAPSGETALHIIGLERIEPQEGVLHFTFEDEAGAAVNVEAQAVVPKETAQKPSQPTENAITDKDEAKVEVTVKEDAPQISQLLAAPAPFIFPEASPSETVAVPEQDEPVSDATPQAHVFSGTQFGVHEIVDYRPDEKIYLTDAATDTINAQFIRDTNGVKFEITLNEISASQARIFGYVPVGEDITIFGKDGRPVGPDDAVFVYGDGRQNLRGGDEDNIIIGTSGNEWLRGKKGDDLLHGGGGNDRINGGRGNDILDGGEGDDRLTGGRGDDVFAFSGDSFGNDLIVDYALGDRIHLLDVEADDVFARFVREGNEVFLRISIHSQPEATAHIRVNVAVDMDVAIYGADGTQVAVHPGLRLEGTSGDDYIAGTGENDVVYAGAGNDVIEGGAGDNSLYGEAGDDVLIGGDALDIIDGGAGDDHIFGNGGTDIFIFTGQEFGHDRIYDYGAGDLILLSDFDVGAVSARFEIENGQLQFAITANGEAQLSASVTLENVSQSDFVTVLAGEAAPVFADSALHHLADEDTLFSGTSGADVFHTQTAATHVVSGFDATLDTIGLDVSDATLAAVEAAQPEDQLATLLDQGDISVTTLDGDTYVSVADELRLILDDSDDPIDFTQFDIY